MNIKAKYLSRLSALAALAYVLAFQNFSYPSTSKLMDYYYPSRDEAQLDEPTSWATKSPEEGGFSSAGLDDVISFLANGVAGDAVPDYCGTNTSAFIILHKGKIIKEWYNPNYAKYFSLCKPYGIDNLPHDSNWTTTTQGLIHSASKSMTSTLIGIAVDQGKIKSIDDSVSKYLGSGWTCIAKEKKAGAYKYSAQEAEQKESAITIRNLLTMTSGVGGSGTGSGGVYPFYVTAPGQVWFYNTNLYYQLINVIAAANGLPVPKPDCDLPPSQFDISVADINQYARDVLFDRIGMKHSAYYADSNSVDGQYKAIASSARDMARFGLLILSGGVWRTDGADENILNPQNLYLPNALASYKILSPQAAASGYQNKGYGYLWWLNGPEVLQSGVDYQACYAFQTTGVDVGSERYKSGKLPSDLNDCTPTPGTLAPAAPADMVSALGANDKKIYVIPSLDLVVVRHGGNVFSDSGSNLSKSAFDTQLWEHIMNAKLTPPKITVQPKDVSVIRGEMAQYTITATGNEAPKYQWYKNDAAVVGANANTFSFKATSLNARVRVKCVVSNSLETVTSKEVGLTVLDPIPVIATQPQPVKVFTGATAKFSVVATGTRLSYQWYKNGVAIAAATASTYSVKTSLGDNGAKFKCKVTSSGGSVTSNTVMLTVVPPAPVITTQPVATTVKAGTAAKFSIVASGQSLTYQWFKNGVAIAGATKPTYSFTAQSSSNGLHFKCEVSNSGGNVFSNNVLLTVK